MEVEPWWWAAAAPFVWWLLNKLTSAISVYCDARADRAVLAGEPSSAHMWRALSAIAANSNLGRRPSVRPPPYNAIPTLPPPFIPAPAPLPRELESAERITQPEPPRPVIITRGEEEP